MPLMSGLLIAGGSLISGGMGANAANRAADIQAQAAQDALEEQRRQFNLQWEASAPSRNALARLGAIMSGEENFDVTQLPGYQQRYEQGLQATERAQAGSPGGRFGGRALKELTRYGQDYAQNARENYLGRLAQIAGLSGNPSSPNTAATIMQGGAARAQGVMGSAGAINNAIQGGIGNYLSWQQQQSMMNALNPTPAGVNYGNIPGITAMPASQSTGGWSPNLSYG